TNEVEKVEGGFDEMVEKTIKRAAYNSITIDSEKIDEHLVKMMQAESITLSGSDQTLLEVKSDITNNANKKELKFEDAQVVEDHKPSSPEPQYSEPKNDSPAPSAIQPNENPVEDHSALGF